MAAQKGNKFGGLAGKAESGLKGRRRSVDDAVDAAAGKPKPKRK